MDSAKLPGCFEPCFIELELEGTDNKPDNKWNLATGDLHAFGNDYFGANRSPYQAHEVAIDHQADKDPKAKLEFTLTASVFTSGNSFSFWVYDGADKWFESARYNADGSWKTLNKSKVTLVGASKVYKNVKIDLSGESVKPSPTKPVKVELKKCVLAKEWSGDGANKPHAFIAMGYWYDTETVAEAKKRTLGTMAHELGHLVGMVPKSSSTWVDTGTGWHCTDTKCVMYYSNTTTRGNEFCTVCQDVLRKEDITKYKSAFKHSKGSKA
jgi:hypothetical protein